MTVATSEKLLSREQYVSGMVERHVGKPGKTGYDSVVIAGSGIGSQVFAAQLLKYPQLRGKVTIVAPPAVESRRLINGVSLRGLAADFISSALGVSHAELLDSAAGPGQRPIANRQSASMAVNNAGTCAVTKTGLWQGMRGEGREEPIVYGLRNSRLVAAIRELLDDSAVAFVDEKVSSAEDLRQHALGQNPLLVNATTFPGLLGTQVSKPTRMVLAVQAPLIVGPHGLRGPAEPRTAYAPLVRRDGAIDVGYFTPFSDPLSPRSDWYGIIARVVDNPEKIDKDHEHAIMVEELEGIARQMGLSIDDPDETLAKALVPAAPWGKIPLSPSGGLDLKRMYSGGAPCFYADGMISSAIGGVIGAEAVVRGADPDAAIRSALAPWRRHNFLWWMETNKISPLADLLMRISVPLAMSYPHAAGLRLWRSAA